MIECASCHVSWPADRFIAKSADCFRCRAQSLQFNYGSRGRDNFHGHTVKEFNDRQVREARANGLDPVPARTAATGVPSSGMMRKLESTLKGNPSGKAST